MPKIDFSVGSFLVGVALTFLLIVLDKAGKLKGPMLLVMLAAAAVCTVPLALNVTWVSEASGPAKLSRTFLMLCVTGVIYALIAVWITNDNPKSPARSSGAESNAVAELSRLGWTVKPGTDDLQFEIASRPLPSMKESAPYFSQMNRPFRLHFQSVPSIEGLHELATIANCTKIEINAGEFFDISELRGFSGLSSLIISQTPINGLAVVDASPLSSLTNLRELNLGDTKIRNIEALARLTHLESLSIRETLVRDLSPISGYALLKTLDIRGTEISDLSALSKIETLQELSIGGIQIPGLVRLRNLKNLKTLNVIEHGDIDLSTIGELSNLETLWIWGPSEQRHLNVSPLRKLSNLRQLTLTGLGFFGLAVVTDIEALGDLKELRKLTLGSLQVSDLAFTSKLKSLSEINIGEMPVTSIEPLRGLKSLTSVSLSKTRVTDISPLLELPALTNLNVMRTPARADILTELERRGVNVQR